MPPMGLMGRMGLMPLMDRGVVRKRRKKGRKEARHLTYAGAGGAALRLGRWGRLRAKQAATLDRIARKLRSRGGPL